MEIEGEGLQPGQPTSANDLFRFDRGERIRRLRILLLSRLPVENIDEGFHVDPAVTRRVAKQRLVIGIISGQFAQARHGAAGQPAHDLFDYLR